MKEEWEKSEIAQKTRDAIAEMIIKEFGPTPPGAENELHQVVITATINQVVKSILAWGK